MSDTMLLSESVTALDRAATQEERYSKVKALVQELSGCILPRGRMILPTAHYVARSAAFTQALKYLVQTLCVSSSMSGSDV
eukprot:3380037-Rhodomonas_salina.2